MCRVNDSTRDELSDLPQLLAALEHSSSAHWHENIRERCGSVLTLLRRRASAKSLSDEEPDPAEDWSAA